MYWPCDTEPLVHCQKGNASCETKVGGTKQAIRAEEQKSPLLGVSANCPMTRTY